MGFEIVNSYLKTFKELEKPVHIVEIKPTGLDALVSELQYVGARIGKGCAILSEAQKNIAKKLALKELVSELKGASLCADDLSVVKDRNRIYVLYGDKNMNALVKTLSSMGYEFINGIQ